MNTYIHIIVYTHLFCVDDIFCNSLSCLPIVIRNIFVTDLWWNCIDSEWLKFIRSGR
jgi:hypothetical protein